jgi:hypothetical protein
MSSSVTKLEDLPNELLLIMMKKLTVYDLYHSFSHLNRRFDALVNKLTPLEINESHVRQDIQTFCSKYGEKPGRYFIWPKLDTHLYRFKWCLNLIEEQERKGRQCSIVEHIFRKRTTTFFESAITQLRSTQSIDKAFTFIGKTLLQEVTEYAPCAVNEVCSEHAFELSRRFFGEPDVEAEKKHAVALAEYNYNKANESYSIRCTIGFSDPDSWDNDRCSDQLSRAHNELTNFLERKQREYEKQEKIIIEKAQQSWAGLIENDLIHLCF